MDTLRGNFEAHDDAPLDDVIEDDAGHDAPPPNFGTDERRMQVRAYNFWASLLDNRNFPNVEDLTPETLPDFGPNGVLLDFSRGIEDPAISFLGESLAEECGANGLTINTLSDVPARSLLSRITDHYMQILGNQAPIGFEAEFVNQRGAAILYRGILLPFSSDDDTIDFIYGVINWKEMADSQTADELLLEIDQALESAGTQARNRSDDLPLADWADGPSADAVGEMGAEMDGEGSESLFASILPKPSFGIDLSQDDASAPAEMELADWLAAAREQALAACASEDRTRHSLYEAISRAYDFSLAAAAEPQEFSAMLADAGLKAQDRAPMTPVVKLVFGADYDKTRLTEYAAALSHAQRRSLSSGALGEHLRSFDGGLKGVVNTERQDRRKENGKPSRPVQTGPHAAIANKLRAIEPSSFSAIHGEGQEFALVMIRRNENGDVVMLGEVPEDGALVERAARKLIG